MPADPGGGPTLTAEAFEQRVTETTDLELSWTYWNWLLPNTTGLALWYLFILPAFGQLRKEPNG